MTCRYKESVVITSSGRSAILWSARQSSTECRLGNSYINAQFVLSPHGSSRCCLPTTLFSLQTHSEPLDALAAGSLLFIFPFNRYVTTVPRVTGIGKDSNPDTLDCMLGNCKQEVINCAKDPACRACISCLTACPPNDQARQREGGIERDGER